MTAVFKFETPEEQSAFLRLLHHVPRIENWGQARFTPGETCHICKGKEWVKCGVVPYDDFFDNERLESYTFWSCCQSCNVKGWNVPSVVLRDKMTYWVEIEPNIKFEELIINNFKLFKFPSITLVNLDTILVSI